ncbi:MAG: ATP-binding protein [Anaerolineales bacterium]
MGQRLRIMAALDDVRRATTFVAQAAADAGLSDKDVYHCEVAVEEACTNIVQHGVTASPSDEHHIILSASANGTAFQIIIQDDTPPFNPLTYEVSNLGDELAKRQPGGLGIHFFKNLMDDVSYEYQAPYNQLTLRKRLSGSP